MVLRFWSFTFDVCFICQVDVMRCFARMYQIRLGRNTADLFTTSLAQSALHVTSMQLRKGRMTDDLIRPCGFQT